MITPLDAITWIIVIGFAVTFLITIAGLIKWVEFKDPKHLDQLIKAVVFQVVALAISIFTASQYGQSKYFNQVSNIYAEAKSARDNGNLDLSLEKLNQILQVSDDALPFKLRSVFLDRADIAFNRELWSQAAESYAVYLELNPNDVAALTKAGRSYRELNMYDKAKSLYEIAYNLDSQNWDVLNGMQNCLRRLGSFFTEADRIDVADSYYEKARLNIIAMMSLSKGVNDDKYKASSIALARMEWEREHYAVAIAKFEEIQKEFPDLVSAREDLAAVQLEYGEQEQNENTIEKARITYKELFERAADSKSRVFPGAGLAEAVAISKNATAEDMQQALTAVNLAIANNQFYRDDPYAMYSSARLYWRMDKKSDAIKSLKEAIRLENKRRSDPYTLDYKRLIKYELLLQGWTENLHI